MNQVMRMGTPAPDESTGDRIAEGLIYTQLLGVTFLQKIAVPIGGDTQIFFGLFIMLGSLIFGILTQRLVVRPKLLIAYLAMVAVMVLTQLMGKNDFSVLSIILLMFTTSLYVFRIKPGQLRPNYELLIYRKFILILAMLGVAQFLLQFVVGVEYAFPLDGPALKSFIMQSYNSLNEIQYGSPIIKPNAVFLLEPAMMSKFIAIGLIIEITMFKNLWRIALLFLAQAFTFSGTGLIILFLLLPFYLVQKRQFHILLAMLVFLGSAPYWAPLVGLERTVERTNEFTHPGTSGYARFVSIFPIIRDHLAPDPQILLLGRGAGSVNEMDAMYDYEVHPPSWGKLWIEYGLIGMLAYLLFLVPAIWSGQRTAYLKAALTILILYDNYILIPTAHGLILVLLAWPSANVPARQIETVLKVKA